MKNTQKRTLLTILTGVLLLLAGSVLNTNAQPAQPEVDGPLKTLTGHIRWSKAMGVLPKTPGSTQATDNICAHFFVVVTRSPFQTSKPIQYDIALEEKPDKDPNYYSCRYEMQVPSNVNLAVYAGMGDGLNWRWDAPKSRYHYSDSWIDVAAGRTVRTRGARIFKPENSLVVVGPTGLSIPFELLYENSDSGQQTGATANGAFMVATRPSQSPSNPTGFSVLQWDAGPDHPNAEVWVKIGDSRERTIVAKRSKGGQQIQVIRGVMYTYALMDGRIVLATTIVAVP